MGLLDRIKSVQGNGAKALVQATVSPSEEKKTEGGGILEVSKCEIGSKYLIEDAVGEYTGSSKEWGFFQVGEKTLRVPLTTKVDSIPVPKPEVKVEVKVEAPKKERKMRIEDVPKAAVEKGIRLFLNCIPSGSYETLDDFVNQAARDLAAQYNLDDVRFATDSDHPLAFGRWKGALASLVRSKLPVDGNYVAYTMGSEMVQVVAEALLPNAAFVVRGVR